MKAEFVTIYVMNYDWLVFILHTKYKEYQMAILDGIPPAVCKYDPLKIVGTPVITSTILNEKWKQRLNF